MINKTSKILEKDESALQADMKRFSSIPDTKQFSHAEETEMKSQLAAFQYSIEKTSLGHIVPPEFKGVVNAFEKADFDLDKMDRHLANNYKKTYDELKFAYNSDPGKFKGTSVDLYCNIFEFITGVTFKTWYKRMKKSNALSKIGFGKEGWTESESLENLLYEHDHNLNEVVYSSEGLSEIIGSISNKLAGKNPVVHAWKEVPGIIFDVRNVLTILLILLVIVIIAIIAMTIISMAFTSEMAKLFEKLTAAEIKKNGGSQKARENMVLLAASNMDDNLPITTKKLLFKPVSLGISTLTKFGKEKPKAIDEILDEADKSMESLDYIYDNLGKSQEGVFDTAKDAISKGVKEAWNNLKAYSKTNKGKFIIGAAALAIVCLVLIPTIRLGIYFIGHIKIQLSSFFKEQYEWTESNIEYLIEKSEDPSTPEEERERLKKVIERQKAWAHNFSTWSNALYKDQISAANDTRDDIRDEEKIDFDKLVDDTPSSEPVTEEAPQEEEKPLDQQPILVF